MNEQDIMRNFAASMIQKRDQMNMNAKEFAMYIGIDRKTLRKYENGQSMPYLYTATLIADKLGISLDGLVGRTPRA